MRVLFLGGAVTLYLADNLESSVLTFSPNPVLKGKMVFITGSSDEFLIKVVFDLGPDFPVGRNLVTAVRRGRLIRRRVLAC